MTVKAISRIPLMTALLIVCSWITIPIGPVPFSLQTFAILLIAFISPINIAVGSSLLYLLIGLIGIPVFAGGSGGISSIVMPTFGFVLSFPLVSLLISYTRQSYQLRSILSLILLGLAANIIIYLIGIPYMVWMLKIMAGTTLSINEAIAIGFLPFILGDFIKIVIAAYASRRLIKLIK